MTCNFSCYCSVNILKELTLYLSVQRFKKKSLCYPEEALLLSLGCHNILCVSGPGPGPVPRPRTGTSPSPSPGPSQFWSRWSVPVPVISGPDDRSLSRSFLVLMIGPGPVLILLPVPVLVLILVPWLGYWRIDIKNAQKYKLYGQN